MTFCQYLWGAWGGDTYQCPIETLLVDTKDRGPYTPTPLLDVSWGQVPTLPLRLDNPGASSSHLPFLYLCKN